jgi:hypothetical protein
VSRRSSTREQEDPEVREGVGIANQSGPIGFSHTSTTSSETSSPWKSRLSSPQITVRNNSPVILRPLQFPASFFVVHGISSPSSTSHCRSCSSREFIFRPFFFTTKIRLLWQRTYEIFQKSAKDVPEDQVNVIKDYLKPQTKVRKILTFLTSAPPVKASPGHIPLFYLNCTLYLFILYLALSLGVVMKP